MLTYPWSVGVVTGLSTEHRRLWMLCGDFKGYCAEIELATSDELKLGLGARLAPQGFTSSERRSFGHNG